MRSDGNNFTYFPENKLTKSTNLVQLKRMVMFCLEDLGEETGAGLPGPSLVYATVASSDYLLRSKPVRVLTVLYRGVASRADIGARSLAEFHGRRRG